MQMKTGHRIAQRQRWQVMVQDVGEIGRVRQIALPTTAVPMTGQRTGHTDRHGDLVVPMIQHGL